MAKDISISDSEVFLLFCAFFSLFAISFPPSGTSKRLNSVKMIEQLTTSPAGTSFLWGTLAFMQFSNSWKKSQFLLSELHLCLTLVGSMWRDLEASHKWCMKFYDGYIVWRFESRLSPSKNVYIYWAELKFIQVIYSWREKQNIESKQNADCERVHYHASMQRKHETGWRKKIGERNERNASTIVLTPLAPTPSFEYYIDICLFQIFVAIFFLLLLLPRDRM